MPEKPPKEFWNKMHKKIKESNPDYTEEQIDETVGSIWYNKIGKTAKAKYNKMRIRREGKETSKSLLFVEVSGNTDIPTGFDSFPIMIDKAIGDERPGHKYVRREKTATGWKYIYKDEKGREIEMPMKESGPESKAAVMGGMTEDTFEITGDKLRDLWGKGESVKISGKEYDVHKMSYGDYFLEPKGATTTELTGFHKDTLFLRKTDTQKNIYEIEGRTKTTKTDTMTKEGRKAIMDGLPELSKEPGQESEFEITEKIDKLHNQWGKMHDYFFETQMPSEQFMKKFKGVESRLKTLREKLPGIRERNKKKDKEYAARVIGYRPDVFESLNEYPYYDWKPEIKELVKKEGI